MRTRNPQKLIMIVSLIMQLIMSCLVFQCGPKHATGLSTPGSGGVAC
jgi:hypothetical protein